MTTWTSHATPVATLSLQHDVVVKGDYQDQSDEFAESVREEVRR